MHYDFPVPVGPTNIEPNLTFIVSYVYNTLLRYSGTGYNLKPIATS